MMRSGTCLHTEEDDETEQSWKPCLAPAVFGLIIGCSSYPSRPRDSFDQTLEGGHSGPP